MIIFCIIFLVGCNKKEDTSKEKTIEEVEYLSSQIIDILNDMNKININKHTLASEKIDLKESKSDSQKSSNSESSSDESKENKTPDVGKGEVDITNLQMESTLQTDTENVDWEKVKNKIEILNNSWSIIRLDLAYTNVIEDDIENFSSLLNQSIIEINNENKKNVLETLGKLYSYIPTFLSSCYANKNTQEIQNSKLEIITAYILITNTEEWDRASEHMNNAETSFRNIMNDKEYSKGKESKLNKIYALIKDTQNSTTTQSKPVFYMNYTDLISNINKL